MTTIIIIINIISIITIYCFILYVNDILNECIVQHKQKVHFNNTCERAPQNFVFLENDVSMRNLISANYVVIDMS